MPTLWRGWAGLCYDGEQFAGQPLHKVGIYLPNDELFTVIAKASPRGSCLRRRVRGRPDSSSLVNTMRGMNTLLPLWIPLAISQSTQCGRTALTISLALLTRPMSLCTVQFQHDHAARLQLDDVGRHAVWGHADQHLHGHRSISVSLLDCPLHLARAVPLCDSASFDTHVVLPISSPAQELVQQ